MRTRFLTVRPASIPLRGKLSDLVTPALGAGVLLAAATLLMQNGYITTSGYRLNQLERLRDDWQRQNQHLAAEIGTLRSLSRTEAEARSRWKMEPAKQVLYVDLGAPAAPSGAGLPTAAR